MTYFLLPIFPIFHPLECLSNGVQKKVESLSLKFGTEWRDGVRTSPRNCPLPPMETQTMAVTGAFNSDIFYNFLQDKERFEDMYTEFLMTSQELEKFLSAYLNAIFTRRMKTREALELMTRYYEL